jgi:hypothetical protein
LYSSCFLKTSSRIIALMMEAISTSEMLVNFYQTTRRNNPEGCHLCFFTCKILTLVYSLVEKSKCRTCYKTYVPSNDMESWSYIVNWKEVRKVPWPIWKYCTGFRFKWLRRATENLCKTSCVLALDTNWLLPSFKSQTLPVRTWRAILSTLWRRERVRKETHRYWLLKLMVRIVTAGF